MAKLDLVAVQPWHAEWIAADMRAADVAEVWALHHMTPEQALQISLSHPGDAWTALIDDEPVAIFGVVPVSMLGGCGVAWLLGSRALDRHWRVFVRQSKPLLAELFGRYDTLVNVVHIDNRKTLAWLRWLGAVLDVRGEQVRFELCAR